MQLASRFNYGRVRSSEGDRLMATGRALTETNLRQYTPSVFAEQAHQSRSERYAYVPTIDVVRGLDKSGFIPVFACEAKARDESKHGYTKHMIRFRRADQIGVVGDVAELILVNSHDGSTRYQLMAGWFRSVCANGMICGSAFQQINVRHSGNAVEEVINGAFEVSDVFSKVIGQVDNFKSITLSENERLAYAMAALEAKYGVNEQGNVVSPISREKILLPVRYEDRANDLYTTFNVVQEHLVRGGDRGRSTNGRRVTTRPVNGIDGNVKLNRALWTLTEEMARLKQAA